MSIMQDEVQYRLVGDRELYEVPISSLGEEGKEALKKVSIRAG
jgi:hypothetical protein